MSTFQCPLSLRTLLVVDAVICAASGAALVLGAAALGRAMELPPALLFWAGLVLLPIAVFMALPAVRPPVDRGGAGAVVAGNLLWVAASLLLVVSGLVEPNALGAAFLVVQALVVAVLAGLEYAALRQSAPREVTA